VIRVSHIKPLAPNDTSAVPYGAGFNSLMTQHKCRSIMAIIVRPCFGVFLSLLHFIGRVWMCHANSTSNLILTPKG